MSIGSQGRSLMQEQHHRIPESRLHHYVLIFVTAARPGLTQGQLIYALDLKEAWSLPNPWLMICGTTYTGFLGELENFRTNSEPQNRW